MSEEADTIETTEKVGQVASPETVPTEQSETVETVETAPVNQAEYDAAVAQGKQLAATITVNKLKLGELAAGIEAKYDRLADYAEATGVPYEIVEKISLRLWSIQGHRFRGDVSPLRCAGCARRPSQARSDHQGKS